MDVIRSLLFFALSFAFWVDFSVGGDGFQNSRRDFNATASTRPYPASSAAAQQSAPFGSNNDSLPIGGCGDVWLSWLNSSTRFHPSWTSTVVTYTYHNITAQTTTLCDGHPRIIGGVDALTTIATGTSSSLTEAPQNFTKPTPTCQLQAAECTGDLAEYKLCSGGPAPTTTLSDCGVCSIWGGTVQLSYFPITSSASRNLCASGTGGGPTICPLAPTGSSYSVGIPFGATPCDYMTDNITSTRNSGPYLVTDGQTLYRNRVYMSLDTIYASNSCGYVGKQHTGSTLTLASKDIYSIFGYHHEFADEGYSFNFADLTTVPAAQYYANCNAGQFPICYYTGTNYQYGRDFINGRSDVDFGVGSAVGDDHTKTADQWIWDGAHSPALLVPLQVRTLDPAWATCDLNLNGLYDPPKALSGRLTYATPTAPTVPKTSKAAPAATVTSDGPPATADPKPMDGGEGNEYTTPSYTFDPLPTSTQTQRGGPAGEAQPTSTEAVEDPADEDDPTPTAGTNAPGETPDALEDPEPTAQAPSPADGSTAGDNTASPIDSTPTTVPQAVPSDDEQPSSSQTGAAIGGIIASILGAEPVPPTTTNALSVLESATETFGNGNHPAPTNNPQRPPSEPAQALPPQPVVASNGEGAHTLEPISGSAGLYTVAPSSPTASVPGTVSIANPPDAAAQAPTMPITLTSNGYTQTLQPVSGTTGIYTLLPAPSAAATEPGPSGAPFYFSGSATYVAGGETHTIEPLASTSGVFVIDGTETVMRVAPSGSAGHGGTEGDGGEEGQSTIASVSGELPPVVTVTSGAPSSTAGGGVGGEGGGDGARPAQGSACRPRIDAFGVVVVMEMMWIMFI